MTQLDPVSAASWRCTFADYVSTQKLSDNNGLTCVSPLDFMPRQTHFGDRER